MLENTWQKYMPFRILVIFNKTAIAIKNNYNIRPKIINEIFIIDRDCEIAILVIVVILCQFK